MDPDIYRSRKLDRLITMEKSMENIDSPFKTRILSEKKLVASQIASRMLEVMGTDGEFVRDLAVFSESDNMPPVE